MLRDTYDERISSAINDLSNAEQPSLTTVLRITATGLIFMRDCKIMKITCVSGAPSTLVLNDDNEAAGGRTIDTLTSVASGYVKNYLGGMPVLRGIYATVTGASIFDIEVKSL
jgi:hypothetical protein